ncbi:9337_t:CDS:1, partial [Ambispora gerdemannii]
MPPHSNRTQIRERKRRQFTAREKLTILTYLEKHPTKSIRSTANMFNIEPVQIRKWK